MIKLDHVFPGLKYFNNSLMPTIMVHATKKVFSMDSQYKYLLFINTYLCY